MFQFAANGNCAVPSAQSYMKSIDYGVSLPCVPFSFDGFGAIILSAP